jgi:hypothetical protein
MRMIRFVALALALAALTAPVALADVPGVHRETRLEPIASFAAGKPVKVFCGDDLEGWAKAVVYAFNGAPPPALPSGFALIAEGEAYVTPSYCGTLTLALQGQSQQTDFLARSMLGLVHESVHVGTGSPDEWATDCTALSDTWTVAWIYFGIRQPQLGEIYAAALKLHLSYPTDYVRGGYC